MLHALKLRIDPYLDNALNIATQVINSPKTGLVSSSTLVGFGIVDINNALQTISIFVGLIVGGVSLWVMIEKRIRDKKRWKEESAIRNLKMKKLVRENTALENHVKKQSKK